MIHIALFAGEAGMYLCTANPFGQVTLPTAEVQAGEAPADAAARVARAFAVDVPSSRWMPVRLATGELVLWAHLPAAEDGCGRELPWPLVEDLLRQAWRDPQHYDTSTLLSVVGQMRSLLD